MRAEFERLQFGYPVFPVAKCFLPQVDSTNLEAKRRRSEMEGTGLWLIEADMQTQGYGRKGHCWMSDLKDNFYGTFCFPAHKSVQPGLMSLWVADQVRLALQTALKPGQSLIVKWPNDLCIWQKGDILKIGGILLEQVEGMIFCGVGINAASAPPLSMDPEQGVLAAGHLLSHRSVVSATLLQAIYELAHAYCILGEQAWKTMAKAAFQRIETDIRTFSNQLQWYEVTPEGLQAIQLDRIDFPSGALHVMDRKGGHRLLKDGGLYVAPVA